MLVRCVAYREGRMLAEIKPEEIGKYLAMPECFVWVALFEPDLDTLLLMQEQFGVHPLAIEDAQHGHQLPKIEEYVGSVFVVVHMIEVENDEFKVGEVAIFAGRNFILSVRKGAKKGFEEVRARCEHEPELLRRGPGYVLYALIDAVVDRYFPPLQSIEDELDTVEERIFESIPTRENIEALYAIKRRLMIIRHAVSPLLEGLANLSGTRVPLVCMGMQEYFRDISDHLQRLSQTIESNRETVATAISVNLSMITLQESETTKRLASYAALIAIPTLIAGIYGMNFEHMPELHWKYGYAVVMSVMAIIDLFVFFKLRKARWL
jgi:magnesium transporter